MSNTGHMGQVERHDYLVDNFRVSFESGSAWHCACYEFTRSGVCRHTREAAGMRAAQALIARRISPEGAAMFAGVPTLGT